MIVFYKVPNFYQETTSAAVLMVIGLFDVEVGQIQCASWDVFSTEFHAVKSRGDFRRYWLI